MTTVDHTARAHAPMSASRMHRIVACPASFQLENKMPQQPAGEAAERGTHIHELAEKLIFNNGDLSSFYDENAEDLEIASDYAVYIAKLKAHARKWFIEMNVNDGLQQISDQLGGTADAVVIENNTLHIVDLKTGRVPVKAEDNIQLLTYAVGVALKLKAPLKDITIKMHIWQPGNINTWEVPGQMLISHQQTLAKAVTAAQADNPSAVPSTDACKYCRAKPICPAMREKVQDAARKDFEIPSIDVDPDAFIEFNITPEMLEQAQMAIEWGESIVQAAKTQIINGKTVAGWKLKPGRKMKSWAVPAEAEQILRDKPEAWTLKSVSAVEKLGIDLTDLIVVKISEPSLTRE